jgi:hypothetical protein
VTAPLTPPDCDLTDFQRMMIDIPRLRGSGFDAIMNDSAWRAGFNLWLTSWHQVPAASLPDNDVELTKAAGLGRDIRTWRKVKDEALRGWTLCDDGRLYHETVAEFALEAWLEKLAQRLSSGAGNAKRWKVEFDPRPIEAEIDRTASLLTALNPKSKALEKLERRRAKSASDPDVGGNADGTEKTSRRDAPNVPSGSQEKGTGKGNLEEPPIPPAGGQATSAAFEKAWSLWHADRPGNRGKGPAWGEWPGAATDAGGEDRLLAVVGEHMARLAKAPRETAKAFHRWLRDRGFEAYLATAPAKTARWLGPAEVWTLVTAVRSEAYARTWLADCTWTDIPRAIVGGPTCIARLRGDLGAEFANRGIQLLERAA